MKHRNIIRAVLMAGTVLSGLAGIGLMAQQNKDTVKVPGGLALSEFKGYEDWQIVAPSLTDSTKVIRAIVANPVMIKAYREGIPANGKSFPDGSKIAKLEWEPKLITDAPFSASAPDTVAGPLKEVEFIEKDSKRFPDTHGWGYAAFNYDPATDLLSPVTSTDRPPQGNDAKCGAACHTIAAAKDYIFTAYPKR
jgi:Cytochrome P460